MIDRRTLIGLTAALPFTNATARLDMADPRHDALNTEGVKLIGISPDGAVLVGIRNREQVCFLDATTRFLISESEAIPEISMLDELSHAWSPDGTRFAFSINTWMVMRDSDIFVVDVESGEVSNVTAEGHEREADSLMEVTDVQLDMYPVWRDNETLLFARHENFPPDSGNYSVSLVTMDVETSYVEPFADLSPFGIEYVVGPMVQQSNGNLIFHGQNLGNVNRLTSVSTDGAVTEIEIDQTRVLRFVDANDTHAIVRNPETYELLWVPLDSDDEAVPLWDEHTLEAGFTQLSDPVFGPGPNEWAILLRTNQEHPSLYRYRDGEGREIAQLVGEIETPVIHWAGDSILITGRRDAWLVDLG